MFTPAGRECDADGLEDPFEPAFDVHACGGALAVLLDRCLLKAVETADRTVPFDCHIGGPAAVGQLLPQDRRIDCGKRLEAQAGAPRLNR